MVTTVTPPTLKIKKGDYGFNVDFFIKDAPKFPLTQETPRDLTGFTIKLVVTATSGGAVVINPTLTAVTPVTSGIARWAVSSADATALVAGTTYFAEIQLTKAGYIESTQTFSLEVGSSP